MVAKDLLKTMRDQIDRLNETSYMIPAIIIDDFKKRYDGHTDISRPEIANGLDPVLVYRGRGEETTPSVSPFTLSSVVPTGGALPPTRNAEAPVLVVREENDRGTEEDQ
jgi:hypothetical protein